MTAYEAGSCFVDGTPLATRAVVVSPREWRMKTSIEHLPESKQAQLQAIAALARVRGGTEYPAQVQLVVAANPCPCAKPSGDISCECTPLARRRYLSRLSGPLLDRIDVQVVLTPLRASELMGSGQTIESSVSVSSSSEKTTCTW